MTKHNNRITNPILGYVVIAVSLIVGMLAASAFGQNPTLSHAGQRIESLPTRLVQAGHGHVQRRWILGVRAAATEAGYLIRSVEPRSAASQSGLEPGDRVIAIDGQQVGLVGHRLVGLSDTLESCGGHDGRVRVLVQDRRTRRLVTLSVTLRHPAQHLGN